MRKSFFTLMLAIVSSVWMINEAGYWCMPSVRTTAEPWIEVNGTFQADGFPCEHDEECPPCLTIVLATSDKTYYLVTDDGQLIEYLDTIQLGTKATVTGIPFTRGSYDYIQVSLIETDQKLPSLCDQWNVLEVDGVTCGGCEVYRTMKYCLTTDTIIGGTHYVKLMKGNAYEGALREGNNRDIYFIPSGSTHEYLLYAFNAQVNDMLDNLYIGETCPEGGHAAFVEAISEGTPRVFTIRVLIPETKPGMESGATFITDWIEGVGYGTTPLGKHIGPLTPADSRGYSLLCAYKNGEQIYVSELGEQYGCVYNYDPFAPVDTIPLFARDDSGSSTVDPVDPNQVVVTLKGDELTIREFSNVEVTYTLWHNEQAKMPSSHRAPQSDTFRDEVTIQITQSGEYLLELTNPSWGYTIFGEFDYLPQGIETVHSNTSQHKVLLNGQLYILRGKKIYIITGQRVK